MSTILFYKKLNEVESFKVQMGEKGRKVKKELYKYQ